MINLFEPKIMRQRLKTTDETLDQKTLLYLFAGLVKNTQVEGLSVHICRNTGDTFQWKNFSQ
jgi:hypothetical protein